MLTIDKPTNAERLYASDLNARFLLDLSSDFLDDRKKVKRLIHGLGFHKHLNEREQKYTGIYVERTFRNGMENGASPEEIKNRLNNRVSEIYYDLEDVFFIMEILTNSRNPPRPENLFVEGAELEEMAYNDLENQLFED